MSGVFKAVAPGGTTTLCRLWRLERQDSLVMGFTDHDCDLMLEGLHYRAGSGLSASALVQASGLSVDNTEAVGALSDAAISAADLAAGRYDGAELRVMLADWQDLACRQELFRGSLGEITRRGAAFQCEIRGLSEALSRPLGFAYGRSCSAVLGDQRCGFNLNAAGYRVEVPVGAITEGGRRFALPALSGFEPGWFSDGRLDVLSGAAAGLGAMVKSDGESGAGRQIDLWQGIRAEIRPGDLIGLTAGCDKRAVTCRAKFNNLINFRGFPFLPSEDWLVAWPRPGMPAEGGSLFPGRSMGFSE